MGCTDKSESRSKIPSNSFSYAACTVITERMKLFKVVLNIKISASPREFDLRSLRSAEPLRCATNQEDVPP